MSISQNTPLRAIIWCAVSSLAQAGTRRKRTADDERDSVANDKVSLDVQEKKAREVCEQFGWTIADVLSFAHSRDYRNLDVLASMCRSKGIYEPDRLMAHCDARDFDVLICWDGDRLGRTSALINDIAHLVIRDTGARIYSVNDKYMVESEDDFWVLLTGVRARHENKKRVEQWREGTANRVARGLPLTSKVPMSHVLIRNSKGQADHLEVNESLRRLWDDLAQLIVQGVGWRDIEQLLYTRYGHTDTNGNPFRWTTLQHLLYNPLFWGHSSQNHTNKKANGHVTGLWAFDESEPIPDGIVIYRNTVPPVYTGELAERVKAELTRRTLIIKGRARPQDTNQFTGLFVCGECGTTLSSHTRYHKRRQRGLRCLTSQRKYGDRPPCSQKLMTPYWYVREWLNNALRQWLEGAPPEIFTAPNANTADTESQIKLLDEERGGLERRINTLIVEQSNAPESAQGFYRRTIAEMAERAEILQRRLYELQRETKQAESISLVQSNAIDELREIGLEAFWELPDGDINRLLSRIFGNRQLVVLDRQIVTSVERRRKRSNSPYARKQ